MSAFTPHPSQPAVVPPSPQGEGLQAYHHRKKYCCYFFHRLVLLGVAYYFVISVRCDLINYHIEHGENEEADYGCDDEKRDICKIEKQKKLSDDRKSKSEMKSCENQGEEENRQKL